MACCLALIAGIIGPDFVGSVVNTFPVSHRGSEQGLYLEWAPCSQGYAVVRSMQGVRRHLFVFLFSFLSDQLFAVHFLLSRTELTEFTEKFMETTTGPGTAFT